MNTCEQCTCSRSPEQMEESEQVFGEQSSPTRPGRGEPWDNKKLRYQYRGQFMPNSVGQALNHGKRHVERRARRKETHSVRAELRTASADIEDLGRIWHSEAYRAEGEVFGTSRTVLHLARTAHLEPRLTSSLSGADFFRAYEFVKYNCVVHDLTRVPAEVRCLLDEYNRRQRGKPTLYAIPTQVVHKYAVCAPASAPCADVAFTCEDCGNRACAVHCHGLSCKKCRQPVLCLPCVHTSTCTTCEDVVNAKQNSLYDDYDNETCRAKDFRAAAKNAIAATRDKLLARRCRACGGDGNPSTTSLMQASVHESSAAETTTGSGKRRSALTKHERRARNKERGWKGLTDPVIWAAEWEDSVLAHGKFGDLPKPPSASCE